MHALSLALDARDFPHLTHDEVSAVAAEAGLAGTAVDGEHDESTANSRSVLAVFARLDDPALTATRFGKQSPIPQTVIGAVPPVPHALIERQNERFVAAADSLSAAGRSLALDYLSECGHAHDVDARGILLRHSALPSNDVGIDFDLGLFARRYPHASLDIALQRLLPCLASIQLSDHSGDPDDARILPPGAGGAVDHGRTYEILAAIRFRGPCIVRLPGKAPGSGESRDVSDDRLVRELDVALDHLRDCGWFG